MNSDDQLVVLDGSSFFVSGRDGDCPPSQETRPDRVLTDPRAVDLVDSLDFPFERRFGAVDVGRRLAAQGQALRARCFDDQVRAFLAEHPDGTVVVLGEGLETQFWRVDNGQVRWVSVDLPEVIALRERLVVAGPRQRLMASPALDERWIAAVDDHSEVFISTQGLLMYLQPAQVRQLIAGCARRFPGGLMCFDAVPRWFSARTLRGAMTTPEGYRPPPSEEGAMGRRRAGRAGGLPAGHAGLDPDRDQLCRDEQPAPLGGHRMHLAAGNDCPSGRGQASGWLTMR